MFPADREPICVNCGQPDVLCSGDCISPHARGEDDYGIVDDDTGEFIPHEPEDDGQPDDLTEQADFEQADEYFDHDWIEDGYLDAYWEDRNEYFDDPGDW